MSRRLTKNRRLMVMLAVGIQTVWSTPGPAQTPAQEQQILRRAFAGFDKDNDGKVTQREFPGDPVLFQSMDKNRDRIATFEEYRASALATRLLAAVREDKNAPRPRQRTADLVQKRLACIARFDGNRDGRVTPLEWTGSPASFRALDLDGNGVLDKKDQARATAEAAALDNALGRLPEVRVPLPTRATALTRFDKNKDSTIDEKEAAKTPFRAVFRHADTNRNGKLERRELDRIISEVNQAVRRRNQGYVRPRAPSIPFGTWDKNKDGRLDTNEFLNYQNLFKAIDTNRDAAVTEDELLRYKRSIEGTNFLEKFDLNGDRKVTREEFAGTRAAFDRADRNGDGVISSRDRS